MAAHVDVKRYQIISLLYIIFICFSVLNIKVSLLDSNTYAIKSFESIEEEVQKKITISKLIVVNNDAKLSLSPKAKSYLLISARLSKSHEVISALIEKVQVDLKKLNETVYTQFNSRNKTEKKCLFYVSRKCYGCIVVILRTVIGAKTGWLIATRFLRRFLYVRII